MTLSEGLFPANGREHLALLHPTEGPCTYGELADRRDRFAAAFQFAGVRPGDAVALGLPKSADAVAALLATLQVGAHFAPVDPASPPDRTAEIFGGDRWSLWEAHHGAVPLLAAQASTRSHPVPGGRHPLTLLERDVDAYRDPSAAYRLPTSGSTGRPKGVLHSHDSALAFVRWVESTFEGDPFLRWPSLAGFHFDLSLLDLFVPLRRGGCVLLVPPSDLRMPPRLAALLEAFRPGGLYTTPTVYGQLLQFGRTEQRDLSTLRLLLSAGEALTPGLTSSLLRRFPEATLYNLYGPTETNVATFHRVALGEAPIPIGHGLDHFETRVVEGELWVRGTGRMLGYVEGAKLTTPFIDDAQGNGWYPTGDLVSGGPKGWIYEGRRDRQLKFRGLRVEPGEIEAVLEKHPKVKRAAVVVVGTPAQLVACLTDWDNGKDGELREHCRRYLPVALVPNHFRSVEGIPHTSTDKVDYARLEKDSADALATQPRSTSVAPE